ncbi:hypothetical protein [Methyloceanibacter sp.]|uniref:hypothetical protein n=1 Tax=Methyloceanibacter sp. TaxID=1965321 RepID=UPI003D6D3D9F
MNERDQTTIVKIELHPKELRALKEIAEDRGESVTNLVSTALRRFIFGEKDRINIEIAAVNLGKNSPPRTNKSQVRAIRAKAVKVKASTKADTKSPITTKETK